LCNSLYVPHLRDLRAAANVSHMPMVSGQRLAARLQGILIREDLRIDRALLSEICHLSNGDIRSCLNTLQFLAKSAKNNKIESRHVDATIRKDVVMGIWSMWSDMFTRKERSKYLSLLHREFGLASPNKMDAGYVYVMQKLRHFADMDTLTDGAFQHYLKQAYTDYDFSKTRNATDWFSLNDVMTKHMYTHQYFALQEYTAFVGGQCFLTSATMRNTRVDYPREMSSARALEKENVGSLAIYARGLHGALRTATPSIEVLSTDVAPYASHLVNPCIRNARSVGINGMSPHERARMESCVERCVTYGLTFAAKRRLVEGGGSEEIWVMEPDLAGVGVCPILRKKKTVAFGVLANQTTSSEEKRSYAYAVSPALKQEIASLVSQRRISAVAGKGGGEVTQTRKNEAVKPKEAEKGASVLVVPAVKPAVKRDFFGRVIEAKQKETVVVEEAAAPKTLIAPFTVKYQHFDGCTNAIRRVATFDEFA
jgi:chromosome transmission fidelity protein 18